MFKVLIVDNDRPMCAALSQLIKQNEEFQVAAMVSSGEEALQMCEKQTIDLIFMNTVLSGISGAEASEKISRKFPHVSIYLMTYYMRNQEVKEHLSEGISGYLEKPLNLDSLKRVFIEYKETHKESWQTYLSELMTIIRNRNYMEMYYGSEKIMESIYKRSITYPKERMEELLKIGQGIFDSMYFYDKKLSLEELFPLNEALISEKRISQLWLFKVMDYIFEQNSINRYPLLKQVFEYINQHIKEEITLNSIVENCAVSQGYLSRIFKSQFGTSVMEYLHMRKMSLAKGYFCFTDYTSAEIAFKLGYNESSYFSKVFKKYNHMTGKQYRNRMRYEG